MAPVGVSTGKDPPGPRTPAALARPVPLGDVSEARSRRSRSADPAHAPDQSLPLSHSVISDPCDPVDCSPPGSSVHGILQARTLECCHALLQGIFRPRNRTYGVSCIFCLAGTFFFFLTAEPPEKLPPRVTPPASLLMSSLGLLRLILCRLLFSDSLRPSAFSRGPPGRMPSVEGHKYPPSLRTGTPVHQHTWGQAPSLRFLPTHLQPRPPQGTSLDITEEKPNQTKPPTRAVPTFPPDRHLLFPCPRDRPPKTLPHTDFVFLGGLLSDPHP